MVHFASRAISDCRTRLLQRSADRATRRSHTPVGERMYMRLRSVSRGFGGDTAEPSVQLAFASSNTGCCIAVRRTAAVARQLAFVRTVRVPERSPAAPVLSHDSAPRFPLSSVLLSRGPSPCVEYVSAFTRCAARSSVFPSVSSTGNRVNTQRTNGRQGASSAREIRLLPEASAGCR